MNVTNEVNNKFNNPFVSLEQKNFRYYWIGMCISLIGTWMQNIAQPWLAYSLTNSPFLLSLIGIVQFTPVLIFSLFAGLLTERFNARIGFAACGAAIIVLMIPLMIYKKKRKN